MRPLSPMTSFQFPRGLTGGTIGHVGGQRQVVFQFPRGLTAKDVLNVLLSGRVAFNSLED